MKETIKYEDFSKLDIKVGTILEAIAVENSEKLIKLKVDFGHMGEKQILTGMARWYKPADFNGKQALFVINLETRKMAGLESQGMMLSIGEDVNARPILIIPEQTAKNGDSVM